MEKAEEGSRGNMIYIGKFGIVMSEHLSMVSSYTKSIPKIKAKIAEYDNKFVQNIPQNTKFYEDLEWEYNNELNGCLFKGNFGETFRLEGITIFGAHVVYEGKIGEPDDVDVIIKGTENNTRCDNGNFINRSGYILCMCMKMEYVQKVHEES